MLKWRIATTAYNAGRKVTLAPLACPYCTNQIRPAELNDNGDLRIICGCCSVDILGDESGRVELDAKIARDLLTRPAFAVAAEVSRPYLRGIFLHNSSDNLVAVAADGFRLCHVSTPAATTLSADHSLIIPIEMVKTIIRLLGNASGNVTLRCSERLFAVAGSGLEVVSTKVDSTYPDYERWIPS